MAKTFAAQIEDIAKLYERDLLNVARQSIQEVVNNAQTPRAKGGRLPVVTGNLRNSLISGLNGSFGSPDANGYVLTIAGMKLGDTSRFAWTAAYAMRIELGFSGNDSLGRTYEQQGANFVGAAAANWESIVRKNVQRVRNRRSG